MSEQNNCITTRAPLLIILLLVVFVPVLCFELIFFAWAFEWCGCWYHRYVVPIPLHAKAIAWPLTGFFYDSDQEASGHPWSSGYCIS